MQNINSPLVTVLMTTYNSENEILRSINSVLWQNFDNFELLILNDASTDNTENVIEKIVDKRVKKLNFKKNRGQLWRLNAGKKIAQGKYIAFIDTGDIWFPEFLENMIEATSDGTRYAYCWCSGQIRKPLLSIDNTYADWLYQGVLADTATLFCESSLAKETKFMSDSDRFFSDDLLTLNVAKKEKIKLVPKDLCVKLETTYDGIPHSANFKLTAGWAIGYFLTIKDDIYKHCGFIGLSRHNFLICLKLLQSFQIILFTKHLFLATCYFLLQYKTNKKYTRKINIAAIFKSFIKSFVTGLNYKIYR
jgi:glycosyltransferase involved in cell wall biosynthesis|tara:strand:+ start:4018 stop:4935 length:918 start_codon:yes stop_codon:yes gene_type:complete